MAMDTGTGSRGAGEWPRGPRNLSGFPPPRSQPPPEPGALPPMNYERPGNLAIEPNAPGVTLVTSLSFSGPDRPAAAAGGSLR
jgi:hypothetical protein